MPRSAGRAWVATATYNTTTFRLIAIYVFLGTHVVLLVIGGFFPHSDYRTFLCSDHGLVPRGSDMRGSTVLKKFVYPKWVLYIKLTCNELFLAPHSLPLPLKLPSFRQCSWRSVAIENIHTY